MTIFLIVSFIYPNGHMLRPVTFEHDNMFVHMVQWLYASDTPTNILPSIHVFNSLAIHRAITSCQRLQNHRGIRMASWILTLLIVLSTMFLKQHSVVDVCLGVTMAFAGYLIFYREKASEKQPSRRYVHSRMYDRHEKRILPDRILFFSIKSVKFLTYLINRYRHLPSAFSWQIYGPS